MLCENCHSNAGTFYHFYYGTRLETRTQHGNIIETHIHEEGSDLQQIAVPLCQPCIMADEYQKLKKRTRKSLIWLAVVLPIEVYFLVYYFFAYQGDMGGGILLFGIAGLILWGLLRTPLKTLRYRRSEVTYRMRVCQKDEAGEQLAIKLRAKERFSRVWTPLEYAAFRKKAKPKTPDQPIFPRDLSRRR